MKNMSHITILCLLFTFISHAKGGTVDWLQERNRSACAVFTNPDQMNLPVNSSDEEKVEVIKKVARLLSRIIDLKFKAAEFLDENRELYGEFKSLEQQVSDIQTERSRLEKLRLSRELWLEERLVEIGRLESQRAQKKLAKQVRKEYKIDIEKLRQSDEKMAHELLRARPKYYQAMALWKPFEDYLEQYALLERSLIESLEQFKQILRGDKANLDEANLFNFQSINWALLNSAERENYCLSLYKDWENL